MSHDHSKSTQEEGIANDDCPGVQYATPATHFFPPIDTPLFFDGGNFAQDAQALLVFVERKDQSLSEDSVDDGGKLG